MKTTVEIEVQVDDQTGDFQWLRVPGCSPIPLPKTAPVPRRLAQELVEAVKRKSAGA